MNEENEPTPSKCKFYDTKTDICNNEMWDFCDEPQSCVLWGQKGCSKFEPKEPTIIISTITEGEKQAYFGTSNFPPKEELKKNQKMSLEKRNCKLCGSQFTPSIHNQIYCQKEECRNFSKKTKEQKETYLKNLGKKLNFAKNILQPKNKVAKNKKLEQKIEINGFKILDKIDGLIDKIYFTLRASKIQKYPIEIQEKCKNSINNIITFLENELKNINGGRKIIEIRD